MFVLSNRLTDWWLKLVLLQFTSLPDWQLASGANRRLLQLLAFDRTVNVGDASEETFGVVVVVSLHLHQFNKLLCRRLKGWLPNT